MHCGVSRRYPGKIRVEANLIETGGETKLGKHYESVGKKSTFVKDNTKESGTRGLFCQKSGTSSAFKNEKGIKTKEKT